MSQWRRVRMLYDPGFAEPEPDPIDYGSGLDEVIHLILGSVGSGKPLAICALVHPIWWKAAQNTPGYLIDTLEGHSRPGVVRGAPFPGGLLPRLLAEGKDIRRLHLGEGGVPAEFAALPEEQKP